MSWYMMHRGWMVSPAFKPVPLTDREAWVWLIENAAYDDTTINIRGVPVGIERGSLSYSIRFMSDAWKWSSSERVRRYLQHLERWGMITRRTVAQQSIITICNYAKYQSSAPSSEAAARRRTQHQRGSGEAAHGANKKEEKKEIKQRISQDMTLPGWMPKQDFEAFMDFRKSINKPIKTVHAMNLIVKKLSHLRVEGNDPAEVLNQSIMNGWIGLFPIKDCGAGEGYGNADSRQQKKSYSERMMEATAFAVSDLRKEKEQER